MNYKVLRDGKSCHGGKGKWTPNRKRSVKGDLKPCENGLHYCRDEQVLHWLGEELWEFVDLTPDETIDNGDKMVTRAGKVTKKYETWNERTQRLFAVDCARIAVNRYAQDDQRELLHACLDVTVGYAEGFVDDDARAAAHAAAWDAWDAAGGAVAAAGAAERAAELAAERAAWTAAWTAAGAAWAAAAGAAARAAAGAEQYALLLRYLNGEEGPFVEVEP